ncbi:MAG: hypothetical protein M1524_02605 [Patescibacteria group bacterium]|nr:hypothetical protein [Patescibacteria group bacterium]
MFNEPIRMVFINLVSSSILLSGIIFYKFVYPKKKINLFFLLILISFLPLTSLLRPGDYESGDFNIHMYRIMSFYDSLKEGILMPSWASEINATYGVPLFVFNYPLPYYLVSFFHWIGFNFITSMKIYLGLSFVLSGMFMYLWIKKITNNKLAAFTAGIFYLFAPYHLIDIHFRATPGEALIFTVTPLVFFFITKYFMEKRFISLVFVVLFTDLLFLAHPLLAPIFSGIAILYILYLSNIKKYSRKSVLLIISSLILGFMASIYTWISYFIYAPYTSKLPVGYVVEFYNFLQIFYSPWRYGFLFQGPKGELALIIGYTQIFILITSVIMLVLKKIPKKIFMQYFFWVFLCFSFIFLMHPISGFLWNHILNVGALLMPCGRLSLAISFCISVVAAYFTITFLDYKTKRKFLYLLIIITIGYTVLNWGHRRVIPEIDDSVLRSNVWKSIQITPYFMNSKWTETASYWFPEKPTMPLQVINGEANIKVIKKDSIKHLYVIDAETPITIRENTLYFPGWSLKSNNRYINIYPDKKGVINAELPQGIQYIEIIYEDIPLYKLSKIISAASFLGLLFLILLYYVRKVFFK